MPKLYTKGKSRYYADLRDISLGQHALRSAGSSRATQDEAEALVLMGKLIERLRREGPTIRGPSDSLGAAASAFVGRNPGGVTEGWLGEHRHKLGRARRWFGEDRPLASIKPKDVRGWWEHLESLGLAPGTVRHHLNVLSSLYRFAIEEEQVPPLTACLGQEAADRSCQACVLIGDHELDNRRGRGPGVARGAPTSSAATPQRPA